MRGGVLGGSGPGAPRALLDSRTWDLLGGALLLLGSTCLGRRARLLRHQRLQGTARSVRTGPTSAAIISSMQDNHFSGRSLFLYDLSVFCSVTRSNFPSPLDCFSLDLSYSRTTLLLMPLFILVSFNGISEVGASSQPRSRHLKACPQAWWRGSSRGPCSLLCAASPTACSWCRCRCKPSPRPGHIRSTTIISQR